MNGIALAATSIAALSLGFAARCATRLLAPMLDLRPLARGAIAAALGVSAFLVVTGLVARQFQSFDAGLAAAALAGVVLSLLTAHGSRQPATTEADRTLPRPVLIGFAAAVIFTTGLFALLSWRYQMHDEHAIFGHKSMVEELRRGVYPIYLPPLPGFEARYHYGFDVLAGALARAFMISSDRAIDLVSIGLVVFMGWGAAAIAIDHGAERSAPFAVIATQLGAGLASVLWAGSEDRHPRCLMQHDHPSCGTSLFPTQLLNLFQHPVALAIPLFFVLVLLTPRILSISVTGEPKRPEADRRGPWAASLALIVVLPALALSQIVYFALGSLALLAVLPVWLIRTENRVRGTRALCLTAARVIAVLVVSLLLARLLGGMLAPNETIEPDLIIRRTPPGFPPNTPLLGILWHHIANLGLGFLLLPVFAVAALVDRRPSLLLLFAFAAGGILAAHLYTYQRSWDIVKFPSASAFALSMLYTLVVDRRLCALSIPWTVIAWLGRALLISTGVVAAAFLTFSLIPEERPYEPSHITVDPVIGEVITWFLEHEYESEQMIYALPQAARELAVFGGLSVVAQDSDLLTQGVRPHFFDEQESLSSEIRRAMSPSALRALGVAWVVLSDEEIARLGPEAERRLRATDDTVELAATFEGPSPGRRRRIWRVRGPATP